MTYSGLITATLKLIGALAKTEVPDNDEMSDAFDRLNSMLNTWKAERLTIFQVVRTVFQLVVGQGFATPYTIGIGGDFNVARPVWIQDAGIVSLATTPSFELPIRILSTDEWAGVTIKGETSTLPLYLYYDYAYTAQKGNIFIYPVPSVGNVQLALYIPTPLDEVSDVTNTVLVPPGYEEAIRYNLAMRLCPEWGRPIDPVIAKMAADSLAVIQRANKRIATMSIDAALVGTQDRSVFNWMSGESL